MFNNRRGPSRGGKRPLRISTASHDEQKDTLQSKFKPRIGSHHKCAQLEIDYQTVMSGQAQKVGEHWAENVDSSDLHVTSP